MRIAGLVLVAILAGWSAAGTGMPANPAHAMQQTADPAADFVHNFRLGRNLESMANAVARMTHTYGMVDPSRLTAEIHRLVPKYQPQWDANLAKAYAVHFSPDELRSLARHGNASPYLAKLRQQRSAVGTDMQASSSPILQALVVEALGNVFEQP